MTQYLAVQKTQYLAVQKTQYLAVKGPQKICYPRLVAVGKIKLKLKWSQFVAVKGPGQS